MMSHDAVCEPPGADLDAAQLGETCSATFIVRRSDGAVIEQFLVSPSNAGAPPGFGLYVQRQDRHRCRADVTWKAPSDEAPGKELSTTFELVLDGAAVQVPVRMRLASLPVSKVRTAPAGGSPRVSGFSAGTRYGVVGALAVCALVAGAWLRPSRTSESALLRPALLALNPPPKSLRETTTRAHRSFTSTELTRREDMERVARFLWNQSERADSQSAGLPLSDVLSRFRQTFRDRAPFRGDLRVWDVLLANAMISTGEPALLLTANDLAYLARLAERRRDAIGLPTGTPLRSLP